VRDVARCPRELLVLARVDEERLTRDAEAFDREAEVLRTVAFQAEAFDDEEPVFLDASRESRLQGVLLLADRELLLVRPGRGSVRRATVPVDRGPSATLSRATRALLLEWLAAAAGNLGPRFRLVSAAPLPRLVGLDGFPDEVAAERILEHRGGQVDLPHALSLPVDDGQLGHVRHSGFTKVERTIFTSARRAPGTGPRR